MAAKVEDKLATEQLRAYEGLLSWRKANRDDDWEYIAQYALPQESNITTTKTEGVANWTDRIFDTTIIDACQILASGLYNWWTPPSQAWGEYALPKKLKASDKDTSTADKFLGNASDSFMEQLGRTNFYAVKAEGDVGLAAFASDLIIFDEDDGPDLFNFTHHQIGTWVCEENYKGLVDSVKIEKEMTYRQIKQFFDKDSDNIPEKMVDAAKDGKSRDRKFKILECIFPRKDSQRLKHRRDGANMPIAHVYISIEFRATMRESGYNENPILCRRFKKWVSAYGYGPGYLALPDARQVNYVQQFLDARAEVHVYPRVLVPDNLEGDVDLRAGGVTTWDTSTPEGKPEEWALGGTDYELGLKMQDGRRQAIRNAFSVDAFKLLNSQPLLDKTMTAYEVSQRQAEQLTNLSAVDSRHIIEFHNPLMLRGFSIMYRRGEFGKAPQSMFVQTGNNQQALALPNVLATSRFNDAMKALKNRGREEFARFLLPIAEQQPQAWDILDLDHFLVGYGRDAGAAPDDIREMGQTKATTVSEIRTQRAKLQQQQRSAQMAEQLSKSGKNLEQSPEWIKDQVQEKLQPKNKAA